MRTKLAVVTGVLLLAGGGAWRLRPAARRPVELTFVRYEPERVFIKLVNRTGSQLTIYGASAPLITDAWSLEPHGDMQLFVFRNDLQSESGRTNLSASFPAKIDVQYSLTYSRLRRTAELLLMKLGIKPSTFRVVSVDLPRYDPP